MKLRLNKLMAGLVLAGGAMALVGCGGGDAPTLVVKADANVPITPATAQTARTLVEAASGIQFPLPANLPFPNKAGGTPATVPDGTKLQINQQEGASGEQLGGFELDDGKGGKVEGNLITGSCEFFITGVSGDFAGLGWVVGATFTITPCTITLQVTNAPLNSRVDAPVVILLGTSQALLGNKTVPVLVQSGTGNSAVISVGGEPITETPLPTGAPS